MAQTMKLSKTSASSCLNRRTEPVVHARCAARTSAAKVQQWVSAPAPCTSHFGLAAPLASRSVATRVAATEASAPSSSTATKQYYALVANADFFFNDVQNESIAEQLRERVRFFKEIGRDIDFWLVPEPKWLDAKFPKEAKMVKRPCVALVSTDEMWIIFMKLRLDRVMRINLGDVPSSEALAVGGAVPEFKKQDKWTAPYAPYSSGWWNVFIPKQ